MPIVVEGLADETSPPQFLHLTAVAASLPALSRSRGRSLSDAAGAGDRRLSRRGGDRHCGAADGKWLTERLGRPFVIGNRPGAGTNIATEAVVRSPPDGYTLLQLSTPAAINATLYDKLNFVFLRDIAPVASLTRTVYIIAVHPSFPAKTVPEFISFAKANPGKINMASPGVGTPHHLSGELFKMMAGIDMIHVPYRGDAPALTDLIGGQVQVCFSGTISANEYIRTGRVSALATTGRSA